MVKDVNLQLVFRSRSDLSSFTLILYIFREIVDSKCYTLTYEFVCQLLQPVCFQVWRPQSDFQSLYKKFYYHFYFQERMVLPCRDFCYEFMQNCGNILPGELKDRIRCNIIALVHGILWDQEQHFNLKRVIHSIQVKSKMIVYFKMWKPCY